METYQVDTAYDCPWNHRDFADQRLSAELGDAEEMFYDMVCREYGLDSEPDYGWLA